MIMDLTFTYSRVLPGALAFFLLAGCATVSRQHEQPAADTQYREAAFAAYQADDFDRAERLLADYLVRSPTDAQAWYRLGNVRLRLGQVRAGIDALDQALALDPGLAEARHNRAMAHIHFGINELLKARRELPEVDDSAVWTMRYLACVMETFMGYPDALTCRTEYYTQQESDGD